jgi:hypothetical protein
MIYRVKIGTSDEELPAGERWFARQIEGRYERLAQEALPMEWIERLKKQEEDEKAASAALEHPSS